MVHINTPPKISVIVAVLNGKATLQRCIDSIVRQTFHKWEIIAMDGGSADGTVDILKANDDSIAYWESEPDRGIYHAWNKALGHVKGEWICFMGADDFFWNSEVLEKMVPYLEREAARTRIVYGRVNVLSENGNLLGQYGRPWGQIRRSFRELASIPHQGVFHHHSLFDVHGKFDESLCIAGDYELLLRELKEGHAVFVPDIEVAGMQHGGVSSDPIYSLQALREIGRAAKKHEVGGLRLRWRWVYTKAYVRWLLKCVFGESFAGRITDIYRQLTNRVPLGRVR
ncbi:MAG: PGL/p-HBAD biosynthesis glycosyltransferase [Syntrophomonadaceae bacterium]|nr:PGL/p-HBAD biosynthesis glycosyltransferase [Bacillota bacterium]